MEEHARGAWACNYLANITDDDGLVAPAGGEGDTQAMRLAEVPALSPRGVALKLALVVSEMLCEFKGYPADVQQLALVSSALADCVVLDSGTVVLPARAAAGVPNDAPPAVADWWRQQVAAL